MYKHNHCFVVKEVIPHTLAVRNHYFVEKEFRWATKPAFATSKLLTLSIHQSNVVNTPHVRVDTFISNHILESAGT